MKVEAEHHETSVEEANTLEKSRQKNMNGEEELEQPRRNML